MPSLVIAGGGIGGLTAAIALASVGCRVTVCEQAAEFGELGAGIQLAPNALRVLRHLGVTEHLAPAVFAPQRTDMRAWDTGEVVSTTVLGEAIAARFGAPYWHVHRADLLHALAARAQSLQRAGAAIDLRLSTPLRGFVTRARDVAIQLDGEVLHADALIGADGIHSAVRAQLHGADAPVFTGMLAWRALVPVARLPANFVAPVTGVWMGPAKHFVHYYVRAGTLVNCVCVVETDAWRKESWTERGEHAELAADFAGWHDSVTRLIDAMDRDACYRWAMFDRAPLSRWGEGPVTLLGDAGHPMLPSMAQGAAMAIEDAVVLARCVAAHPEVTVALQAYEDARRDRTAAMQLGSRRNATLFHLQGEAALARNRAMSAQPQGWQTEVFEYDALTVAV